MPMVRHCWTRRWPGCGSEAASACVGPRVARRCCAHPVVSSHSARRVRGDDGACADAGYSGASCRVVQCVGRSDRNLDGR